MGPDNVPGVHNVARRSSYVTKHVTNLPHVLRRSSYVRAQFPSSGEEGLGVVLN